MSSKNKGIENKCQLLRQGITQDHTIIGQPIRYYQKYLKKRNNYIKKKKIKEKLVMPLAKMPLRLRLIRQQAWTRSRELRDDNIKALEKMYPKPRISTIIKMTI